MVTAMAQLQQPPPPPRAGASTSSPPVLRVLDTALVPPSDPAPPECSLPFTFFDIFWLNSPPVERLFLYRLAPDADVPAILGNLKDSLSRALRAFYPLAGRIRLTPGTSERYELHYRPSDGVTFTTAEYDEDVDGLAADEPREVTRISPLVPPLPEGGGAVLALQTTLLSARRGLAVGVSLHHAACDGANSTHFLHSWAAAACARAEAPPPPVIDRSLVPDPRGLCDAFARDNLTADDMQFVKMSADQLLAGVTLSKDDLQRVKEVVATEAARRGAAPPRCSSLVAALGFVWSCYHRAKAAAGSAGGGQTHLLLAVDHRSRVNPPLPDKYFGNCVGPAFGLARVDEVAGGGAGGVFTACVMVAAAIDEAVAGIGTSSVDAWMSRAKEVSAVGALSVAGSPRFRVYEVDLGFGRPAKVEIVSVAKTGAVAVAESRSGAGGIEVGISLRPDGIGRFRKCFADAIAEIMSGALSHNAVDQN